MSTQAICALTCPSCQHIWQEALFRGLRTAAVPHVQAAILARTWQVCTCPMCGATVQAHHLPTVYTDFPRRLYTAVEGRDASNWREALARHQQSFDRCFFLGPELAKELGSQLRLRLVFGIGALREKLILNRAGLDDYLVEVVKGDILQERGLEPAQTQLRVEAVLDGGHLLMAILPRAARAERIGSLEVVAGTPPLGWITALAERYTRCAAQRRRIASTYPWLRGSWIVDVHVTA